MANFLDIFPAYDYSGLYYPDGKIEREEQRVRKCIKEVFGDLVEIEDIELPPDYFNIYGKKDIKKIY